MAVLPAALAMSQPPCSILSASASILGLDSFMCVCVHAMHVFNVCFGPLSATGGLATSASWIKSSREEQQSLAVVAFCVVVAEAAQPHGQKQKVAGLLRRRGFAPRGVSLYGVVQPSIAGPGDLTAM